MKNLKLISIFVALILMTTCAFAQEDVLPSDMKPGITPDSPFYFLDSMFDGLQSPESLANEKAAEVVVMAQENKVEALEKARERYENAMQKRERDAEESEDEAENVTRQASKHMEVLAKAYEKVAEEARQGIEEAMKNSAQGRENALKALNKTNPERAGAVAIETLTGVLEGAPEQARAGLQRALESVGSEIPSEQAGEAEGFPSRQRGTAENATEGEGAETQKAMEQEGKPENKTGDNLRVLVSDAPADIADFEYLTVQLSKARIFSGEGSEEGFEEREIDASVDLTQLVGETATEVLSTNLEPGTYTKIELYVGSVDAKAKNDTVDVMIPSEKLQIVKPFTITEGETTTFVFDINVVRKGMGNEYNLLPVISESGVVGEDLEEDEVNEVESDEDKDEEDECTSDADCEEGYECVNGECEEIEAEEDDEGPVNETVNATSQ